MTISRQAIQGVGTIRCREVARALVLWVLASLVSWTASAQLEFTFDNSDAAKQWLYFQEGGSGDDGEIGWSTEGNPGPGSLQILQTGPDVLRIDARSPCFPGFGGARVEVSGEVRPETSGATCALALWTFTTTDCTGEPAISFRSEGTPAEWSPKLIRQAIPSDRSGYQAGVWFSSPRAGSSCLYDNITIDGPGLATEVPTLSTLGLGALVLTIVWVGFSRLNPTTRDRMKQGRLGDLP